MIIYTDKAGNIKYSSINLNEGLNFIGEIKGKVDKKNLTIIPLDEYEKHMINIDTLKYIYGDAILLSVGNNKLNYIYPNICGKRDVFYSRKNEDEFIFSDDFFEIAKGFTQLNVKKSALQFFIIHGYFLPGETYFEEIRRLKTGNFLVFDNMPIEESVFGGYGSSDSMVENDKDKYSLFKSAIESVFITENISDNDAILLSGGSDSGLLAALSFIRFGKKPALITMKYKQGLDVNYDDVLRAKNIADYYGASHDIAELDLENSSIKILESFVMNMPLAAHLSLGFYNIAQMINQLGKNKLWCGQNADNVYNLGPTTRKGLSGIGNMIKRFYLSKEYFIELSDISGNKIAKPFIDVTGYLGAKLLSYKYHGKLEQPNNFRELMNGFLN